jgi:hypothetical protein
MRRNALRVIGGLYLLVVTPMLFQHFRAGSLARDSATAIARVTSSRPAGARADSRGQSSYVYTVEGRQYSGTLSIELTVGSELTVYYSPSSPAVSSSVEPTRLQGNSIVDVVAVSIGYGFMALIALMLMSLISPPGGSVAEQPEGIGFTKE